VRSCTKNKERITEKRYENQGNERIMKSSKLLDLIFLISGLQNLIGDQSRIRY
jgi:hypothetical protein